MVNSVQIFECDECGGEGLIFWGNGDEYDVETCSCPIGKEIN
jgi:hypothetical protein